MHRQTKLTFYKEYIDMHLYEQYQNESGKEGNLFKSYDMVYNLQKFKMDKTFGGITDQDLEGT